MDKRAFFYNFLFMFISPTVSLLHGLRANYDPEFKRRLLIVFITIYGSIITISETQDGAVHLNNVYSHYLDLPFPQFAEELGNILTFQNNTSRHVNDDVYIHLLSYFTGTILGLPGLFFVFVSFIYGYFFAGSMIKLFYLTREKFKYSWTFYGIATVFILWKNIDGINTVRTWTGLWILFYACLSYYQTKKIKYIFLMFVPPFIHFAYFIMAIPAWIVLTMGVRHKLYIAIFALSFVSVLINPQSFNQELQRTEVGASKVKAYSVDEKKSTTEIIESTAATPFYRTFFVLGVQKWTVVFLAFVLIIFSVYEKGMTQLESSLFSIGLLTLALANSTWFLYSLGNRTGLIGGVFILAPVVLLLKRDYLQGINIRRHHVLKISLNLALILFIPFIIYMIATMIYLISVYMLGFPFIPWISDSVNYSIRDFLGIFI